MQEHKKKREIDFEGGAEVYSTTLRAGKRTYYLDVKSTLRGDHYLSITESRRKSKEGKDNASNLRQTIYIYPEDFEKFARGLEVTLGKINELKSITNESGATMIDGLVANQTDLEFELL